MSSVLVITPLVVANWAAIAAAVSVVAGRKGFAVAQARAQQEVRARRLLRNQEKQRGGKTDKAPAVQRTANQVAEEGRAEIELPNSDILPAAPGSSESLVIERDGVRATFSRDARGALKLCLEGPHLSKAELLALGEDLIGSVTQQYAYHQIMSQLQERRMTIVGEEVSPDKSVKIRVRNF